MAIVLQDTNLFTGTIRDNIRYGNLEATDQEIEAAAQLAGADDFIRRLPDGYDTVIDGDGGSLSQGQRQLLSIARAAVADPPVMILDEATSSIDTRTESIVQAGMDGLMYGRTVFVIAHRLSTVQNADVIMVLELGHIIERGNHAQLIAERGKYYQLYTGALRAGINGGPVPGRRRERPPEPGTLAGRPHSRPAFFSALGQKGAEHEERAAPLKSVA